jgi:hypothetical protein
VDLQQEASGSAEIRWDWLKNVIKIPRQGCKVSFLSWLSADWVAVAAAHRPAKEVYVHFLLGFL